MKTCSLLVAACGCVLAAQAAEIPSATLAADPRYKARHYEIEIPEGEYWWGGEVLEGLKQPFSRKSAKYAVDMRRRHGVPGGDKAAPVLLSSKGRWIWCEQAFAFKVSDGKLVIDTEKNAPIEQGRAEGGTLRAAYLDCSRRHFPPKGHPKLKFFSEPIINTWIALKYNQNEKEILEIADEFIANGVPPGVYMDHTWHGDSFGDWNFHQGRFRDPKGMVKKLNEKGYPVMLWFDPHISTDTALYRWMRKEGMLLRKRDGWDTAESSWWPGKAAILDCTNPKTFAWLKDTCRRLMDDFGVEGFFFDAGDASNYPADAVPYDKLATPSDQVRAFHMIGMEVPYQQHRAAWKMGGLPLMQTLREFDMVGGGTVSNFEGAGFKAAQQHFVRSMQVHALSPMVQFSLSPWKFLDKEHQAIIRDMVALRQRWAGYIVHLAEEAGRTGEPMMRLLEYAYPGHGYEEVSDQFLMGDRLMVAPQVAKDAATRKVHIPPGRWRADDGRVHEGPAVVEVATPLARLPHFEKLTD